MKSRLIPEPGARLANAASAQADDRDGHAEVAHDAYAEAEHERSRCPLREDTRQPWTQRAAQRLCKGREQRRPPRLAVKVELDQGGHRSATGHADRDPERRAQRTAMPRCWRT